MPSKPNENSVAEATFAPFRLAWRLLSATVLLWFVSCVSQIAYIHWRHIDPVTHIQDQLEYYTGETPSHGLAVQMGNVTFEHLIDRWKLHRWKPNKPVTAAGETSVSPMIKRGIWASFQAEIETTIYNTVLFSTKLGVALGLIPLYFTWLFAFGVDGLVQRYIRRACGGYESASIYHRAKLYGTRLLPPFAAVIFMCSPVPISALLIFGPAALFSALLVRLQATYYKKYL